jgi:hypothetical protein
MRYCLQPYFGGLRARWSIDPSSCPRSPVQSVPARYEVTDRQVLQHNGPEPLQECSLCGNLSSPCATLPPTGRSLKISHCRSSKGTVSHMDPPSSHRASSAPLESMSRADKRLSTSPRRREIGSAPSLPARSFTGTAIVDRDD